MKSGSKVFAFEPDRLTYGILNKVVQRKGLALSVETINAAVGNSDGEITFWHNKKHPADHRVATQEFKESSPADGQFSSIPLITIDAFVANRGLRNISFVKIDVQGYELAVCEGMKRTLERFPGLCICLEYCPNAMIELGFEPSRILDFFRVSGYKPYILHNSNRVILADQDSLKRSLHNVDYVDLLFCRQALI
jgi:FkbM family methyltransferase